MHKYALSAWLRAGLCHSLPRARALCGAVQDDLVYNGCMGDLVSRLHRWRYIQCVIALDARHAARRCRTCLAGVPDSGATVVIVDYIQPLDHLVTGLKLRAQLPLADWLAVQLGNALVVVPGDLPDMPLPVPPSPARLRSRGYNQAWKVARRIARRLDIPTHAGALQCVRDNVAQATLDRAERLANLHGAFVVAEPVRTVGCHIGAVDDVMTTGTTPGEITTQLKHVGVICVTNVVASYMP